MFAYSTTWRESSNTQMTSTVYLHGLRKLGSWSTTHVQLLFQQQGEQQSGEMDDIGIRDFQLVLQAEF